ncbi:MAG: glycoside hydrolase family 2 [Bacteroidales bacterium]|nr:glycoside hydrolase family 2 [Bacteroidales bacterium]
MNRRTFLKSSLMLSLGVALESRMRLVAGNADKIVKAVGDKELSARELYNLFQNPTSEYRPFVRWWWNGDKVEPKEIIRELHLLKEAGIGGVEINPVAFPSDTDDLGIRSLTWLSNEWIDMLKVAFDETKSLDMISDLIVGSGWPFGAEYLEGDERASIVVNYAEKVTGPVDYEISRDGIFASADPNISSPFQGRKMKLLSLRLYPNPCNSISDGIDMMQYENNGSFKIRVPEGRHTVAALVEVSGFLQVILGAPGASGPVLNHFNSEAVSKYLNNMSDTIQNRIGPLSNYVRSLFTDSMELEGANWSFNMREEFRKRCGYDVLPYLPFVLFKIGSMGNAVNYDAVVPVTDDFNEVIQRVRYDFEYTKASLILETFNDVYLKWCRMLNVKSRAQAYGRGFFPLETSMNYDIPECESWTMTWLRHKLGEEMSETDYRRGRAYTMVNKYVSSAAHLKGNRFVSCEEMTNTYTVFNMTMEMLKIGGDQTAISGVSHSIFHGFNYSPKEAPFPGWLRYGAYYNENNNWWKFFKLYTAYKGRMSAVMRNSTMYADIAILNPIGDMWTTIGMQNEPFPSTTISQYKTLVWESISKCGGGCDYVSESVIGDALVKNGCLCYNSRKYSVLILIAVERLLPETANKIMDFVSKGGRVLAIEKEPHLSLGYSHDYHTKDKIVSDAFEKIRLFSNNYVFVDRPEKDFIPWYDSLMKKYDLPHYLDVEKPNAYVMQNRYITDDNSEFFFICNSHRYNSHKTRLTFHKETLRGRNASVWDLETGNRYNLTLDASGSRVFDLGPADSLLIYFGKEKCREEWRPLHEFDFHNVMDISDDWNVEFDYSLEDTVKKDFFHHLVDLKDCEDASGEKDYRHFSGTVIYRKHISGHFAAERVLLNLGRVEGVSELFVNGHECGVGWYGRRIHDITGYLSDGTNDIEVRVTTIMGNYMKTLKDNKIAQKWVNRKGREQLYQSMGLIGPVCVMS